MKSLVKAPSKNTSRTAEHIPKKPAVAKPSEVSHRTVGLKARMYKKAEPTTAIAATEKNGTLNYKPIVPYPNKENNPKVANISNESLELDRVQMKDYLLNIIKKIDDCQKETGLVKKYCTASLEERQSLHNNILDQLKEQERHESGLTSMRSEGGLLKIKRKRSTLRIFNPYA